MSTTTSESKILKTDEPVETQTETIPEFPSADENNNE
jgi:hypothetical protein